MTNLLNELDLLLKLPLIYSGDLKISKADLKNIDWLYFVKLAANNRLIMLSKHVLAEIGVDNALLNVLYYREKSKISNMILTLNEIIRIFNSKKYKYLLLKGLIYSKVLFDDLYLRDTSDIDFIFDINSVINAVNDLIELGFVSNENNLLSKIDFIQDTDFREVIFYKNDQIIEVQKSVSCFPHICLYDKIFPKFIEFNTDFNIHTINLEMIFIILTVNAYKEISTFAFRNYVDLYIFVKKHISKINWVKLNTILEKLNLKKHFSNGLKNLSQIYQIDMIFDAHSYSGTFLLSKSDIINLIKYNSSEKHDFLNDRLFYYAYNNNNNGYLRQIKLMEKVYLDNKEYKFTGISSFQFDISNKYLFIQFNTNVTLIQSFTFTFNFYCRYNNINKYLNIIVNFKDGKIEKAILHEMFPDTYTKCIMDSNSASSTLIGVPKQKIIRDNLILNIPFYYDVTVNFSSEVNSKLSDIDYYDRFFNPCVLSILPGK